MQYFFIIIVRLNVFKMEHYYFLIFLSFEKHMQEIIRYFCKNKYLFIYKCIQIYHVFLLLYCCMNTYFQTELD